MESYVLPAGTAAPSLEELQSGCGMERLHDLAQAAEPGVATAQETVGPARLYAPLTRHASSVVPSAPGRPALVGASAQIAAPEPSRTMTFDECKRGLGSTTNFFLKSRFAVCSGASFVQTWVANREPVGVSQFNVRVVGTIAKNSRTINFQYYFTEMVAQGETEVAAMKITMKAGIPQSWPSGVQYTRGGHMPGTKTFTELSAQRTFNDTVNAKPGQGSGTSDLVFAVYQPSITITPPPNATLTGDLKGNIFMLAPRWDAAKYLANSTGGGNPAKKGAATFSYLSTLTLSAKAGAEERAEAQHIREAFLVPQDTKPYMSAKKVPGQAAADPLHRTVSAARIDKNRAAAVKQCKRYWGDNYTNGGTKECDEYPFASTYEGAAENYYDPEAIKFNFSAKPIAKDDNQAGGIILKSFYGKERVIDGLDDGFIVKITV
ncbi:hypothetical protein [Streptomyces sp. NPDC096934]|uniref:NucA/NucB deoxyribonuclease domain-containing protein n=1 Tax=Streptomyces sp. NPDC096934 TaxID=3155551 RepID=UPI00332CA8EC